MILKKIKDKTFGFWVTLYWDCSRRDFVKKIKEDFNYKVDHDDNDDELGKGCCTILDNYSEIAIWINSPENIVTLAHKLLHLVKFWLYDHEGIPLSDDTEEIYAKLHSFFMKKSLKDKPVKDFPSPPRIVFKKIDVETGLLATSEDKEALWFAFLKGTSPQNYTHPERKVFNVQSSRLKIQSF